MRFEFRLNLLVLCLSNPYCVAFQSTRATYAQTSTRWPVPTISRSTTTELHVVGVGPDQKEEEEEAVKKKELVAGVDYEVPDHESYRLSRRSKGDEECDAWFSKLMGTEDQEGILGSLTKDARRNLMTPVPLVNEIAKPFGDPEWTPYVNTKLPWTPLVPAFGLEEFGLPIPRRNAEAWRHFDVVGMIAQNYEGSPQDTGVDMKLTDEEVTSFRSILQGKGGWLDDDACQGRLVYINGRYAPQLSKSNDIIQNLESLEDVTEEERSLLSRLTDGFTDTLVTPVPMGDDEYEDSFKKLSSPDHCMGNATTQFAINTQQGTACFAALNTLRTGAVASIRIPEGHDSDVENPMPVVVVNAVTNSGGSAQGDEVDGVAFHPRCLVVAGKESQSSFVQTSVDLDDESGHVPKLYNGYTQIMVDEKAKILHSFLDESGGLVTIGVEKADDEFEEGERTARDIESRRNELKDTRLEALDVHVRGEDGAYEGRVLSIGGSGRVRLANSVTLLQPKTHAGIRGFSLSGGAQQTDMKTQIHHIAQGTTSDQIQKSLIGGRATGSFRGRIRVEQSAQQTDSTQIARTVLLTDRCKSWSVPSLEIIADDVQCQHGVTVSDLSDEELFYLRTRGLDRETARKLLMFAFAEDICNTVEPSLLKAIESKTGLQQRVSQRLQRVVPQKDRAILGEFQSV